MVQPHAFPSSAEATPERRATVARASELPIAPDSLETALAGGSSRVYGGIFDSS
jgi:hypothetical protein